MTTAGAAAAQQERRRRKDFRLDSCWERRMQMSFSREQVWESHYLLILRASYYCMLKEGALFFFQQEIFSFVFCQLRVSSSSFEMCAKIWMALRRQVGDSQQTGQTRTRSFDFWTKKVLVPPAPHVWRRQNTHVTVSHSDRMYAALNSALIYSSREFDPRITESE